MGLSVNDVVIYNKEIKTFVFICSHFCCFGFKTKSFKLNQKKEWMRLIFVFLFLEESVWGCAERVAVFYFPKNIFIFGNFMFPEITKD